MKSFLQDCTNHTFADRSRYRSTCASKCSTVSSPVYSWSPEVTVHVVLPVAASNLHNIVIN